MTKKLQAQRKVWEIDDSLRNFQQRRNKAIDRLEAAVARATNELAAGKENWIAKFDALKGKHQEAQTALVAFDKDNGELPGMAAADE